MTKLRILQLGIITTIVFSASTANAASFFEVIFGDYGYSKPQYSYNNGHHYGHKKKYYKRHYKPKYVPQYRAFHKPVVYSHRPTVAYTVPTRSSFYKYNKPSSGHSSKHKSYGGKHH